MEAPPCYGFFLGIWWGAIVVSRGSLWPVIILHAASNAAVAIHGLTYSFIEPATTGYLRANLFELPLIILGLWLLMRVTLPVQAWQGVTTEGEYSEIESISG